MKSITRKRLIKLITSRAFYDFILTEEEALSTNEVCDWLMIVDSEAPKKIKKESEEIERIGREHGLIIENCLWIDIQIASVEARTKANSNDNSLSKEILETNTKKASQKQQMEWISEA